MIVKKNSYGVSPLKKQLRLSPQGKKLASMTPGWSSIDSERQNYKPTVSNEEKTTFQESNIESILYKIQSSKSRQSNAEFFNAQHRNIKCEDSISPSIHHKGNRKLTQNTVNVPYCRHSEYVSRINFNDNDRNRSFEKQGFNKEHSQKKSNLLQVDSRKDYQKKRYLCETESWKSKLTPEKTAKQGGTLKSAIKSRLKTKTKTPEHKSIISNKENITSNQRAISPLRQPYHKKTQKGQKSPLMEHKVSGLSPRPRFKEISIHDHLYLESIKKENKKMAELIVENEYFKKKYPFHPVVGEHSQELAKSKFSKVKNQREFVSEFETIENENQMLKQSSGHKCGKQNSNRQEDRQLANYQTLNSTFYLLSGGCHFITRMSLKEVLESLPMPCIKEIEPIIESFYKEKQKQLMWTEFLYEFNSKCKNKRTFFKLMQKLLFKIDDKTAASTCRSKNTISHRQEIESKLY